MPEQKRILIAGAGVAGPACALMLTRAGHKCTVVERAPEIRLAGQQIDVSGEGLKVLDAMGIRDEVYASRVKDDGLKIMNEGGGVVATFPLERTGDGYVKEYEIMRPDLAGLLYEHTNKDVEYIFGDYIAKLDEHDGGVTVGFANSTPDCSFDLVIAADGLRSQTRAIAFEPSNTLIVSKGMYASFFDVPWQESDGSFSRVLNAPGGRCVLLRPAKARGTTGAYLMQCTTDSAAVATADDPKQEVIQRFQGVGWETDRVLKELQSPRGDSFYVTEIAQAKSSVWTSGRVALLGDAGYCPSPVSGQGTTMALIGAYVLAGCIATYPDPREAFQHYEKDVRPFVEKAQYLPPGIPWIINPQSALAIRASHYVLWLGGKAVNAGAIGAFSKLGSLLSVFSKSELKLPKYPAIMLEQQ